MTKPSELGIPFDVGDYVRYGEMVGQVRFFSTDYQTAFVKPVDNGKMQRLSVNVLLLVEVQTDGDEV